MASERVRWRPLAAACVERLDGIDLGLFALVVWCGWRGYPWRAVLIGAIWALYWAWVVSLVVRGLNLKPSRARG